MKFKLSTKLITSFILVAVVLFIVGMLGYKNIKGMERETINIIEAAPLVDAAMEMKYAVARDMQMIMELLAAENKKELDKTWEEHVGYAALFDTYADAIMHGADTDEGRVYAAKDPKLIRIVRDAKNFHTKEFQAQLKKIYGIISESFNSKRLNYEELNKADEAADNVAMKVLDMLEEVEKGSKLLIDDSVVRTREIASASKIQSVLGIVIGFILAVVLGIITTRAIVLPVAAVNKKLSSAAAQVASVSEHVSSASQQLAEASSEQASSIEETSSSLEEITGMVNNNVGNAEKSNQISENVTAISSRGNESMEQLIRSMEDILASNEKIQDLVKVIGEIGEKTAVIDEIVFQTKLLSFNASVEAERAGEHGRGFAVVAQEVGTLAQMSGRAATEISAIVKNSIKDAEAITSENKRKVEIGNALVQETAKILKDVAENASTVTASCSQILSASKEQSGGINQINNAIALLDKATQENASTAEEAASSSEELSAQADMLTQIVESLTLIVDGQMDQDMKNNNMRTDYQPERYLHYRGNGKNNGKKGKRHGKSPVNSSNRHKLENKKIDHKYDIEDEAYQEPVLSNNGHNGDFSSETEWERL